jgi:hypothetical protein
MCPDNSIILTLNRRYIEEITCVPVIGGQVVAGRNVKGCVSSST